MKFILYLWKYETYVKLVIYNFTYVLFFLCRYLINTQLKTKIGYTLCTYNVNTESKILFKLLILK